MQDDKVSTYATANVITDFEAIVESLSAHVNIIGTTAFSPEQRNAIAGLVMKVGVSLIDLNLILNHWGYIHPNAMRK